MRPDALRRTAALIRHNTMLMAREPGPLASRLILPLAFLLLLHPLYEQAQPGNRGVTQAVVATLVTLGVPVMAPVVKSRESPAGKVAAVNREHLANDPDRQLAGVTLAVQ